MLTDEFDYCGRPLTLLASLKKGDACKHTRRLVGLAATQAADGARGHRDHRRAQQVQPGLQQGPRHLQGRRAAVRRPEGRQGHPGRVQRLRVPVLRRGPPHPRGVRQAARLGAAVHDALPPLAAPQRHVRRPGGAVRPRRRQVLAGARRALRQPALAQRGLHPAAAGEERASTSRRSRRRWPPRSTWTSSRPPRKPARRPASSRPRPSTSTVGSTPSVSTSSPCPWRSTMSSTG